MALIKYDIDFIGYDQNGFIQSGCNGLTFLNLGTATANIESVPLQQNQSLAIDGNRCEFIDRSFQLNFTNTGSQTQNSVVIKKTYLE